MVVSISEPELVIYRGDFAKAVGLDRPAANDDKIKKEHVLPLLERLLGGSEGRPYWKLEQEAFMRAVPFDADGGVSFATFMGVLHPGWTADESPAPPSAAAAPPPPPAPTDKAKDAPTQSEGEKAVTWEKEASSLTDEEKNRILLHAGFDEIGDGNGTVEKEELEAVDKRGKMFSKLDTSADGHVTLEMFEAYFGSMKSERGEKAVEGLLKHMESFLNKQKKAKGREEAVQKVVEEKKSAWETAAEVLTAEQREQIAKLHKAFDELGDGNGTVEKEEIEAVDKRGKMFAKLDTSSTGHVTVEAFQAFFGNMKSERGEAGAVKLIAHLENHIKKEKERCAAVKKVEDEKAVAWEKEASSLTDEERNRLRLLHAGFDEIGDGNGTVEKEELEAVDKRGKMFAKLDTSSTGHVTVEAFEAYFGNMKSERGEKSIIGLMDHMEKYVDNERTKLAAAAMDSV